jgi:CDP-4-dehydro-6-deoxyglucose reductase/ferredoxin-NAD(P)+ reductase (naphthalene dioxygenase ferredoxin-specific)
LADEPAVSFKVAIKGRSEAVAADMGETILAAALRAGVPYPCGCRSGNCGACKSTLASGEIEMSPYSDYALSKAERESGLILACRAVPWSDCEVAWLEADDVAMHPIRHLDCEVTGIAQATHDIRILRMAIRAGGPFDFSAGQYASVIFDNDRLPPRDFSMANRPGGDALEFHIRLVPGGAVTPYVAALLKPGERVRVIGPYGNAFYRPRHAGPILALAGGSGLAPIKSTVEEALARGAKQPIHLYFGVRAERDLYLEEHFRALADRHANLKFVPVLSAPDAPAARRTGFLSEAIGKDFSDLDGFKAYLAGPPVMVETCTRVLKRLGLARQNCHADAFYTEADKAKLEGGE